MARSRSRVQTLGTRLANRVRRGCQAEGQALNAGSRNLAILEGVTPTCEFLEPAENVLSRFGEILVGSARIFKLGNSIVMEVGSGDHGRLVTISLEGKVEANAFAMLANLMVCQVASAPSASCQESGDGTGKTVQFSPPKRLVELVVNHEPTLARLPQIECYSRRPLFDHHFHLRGPGWHDDVGYLIHGSTIEPRIPPSITNSEHIIDMLPPRLRELLLEFPLKSDPDLVNAVGALLTAFLANRLISTGKAVFILDGNQPSVGKTLFARCLAVLFDGREPDAIDFSADQSELRKQIGATLMSGRPSVILIDNCKPRGGCVESAFLEGLTTSPGISLRILGQSKNYEQPNDVIWLVTMNNTRLGPDLTERSCPIRFFVEGDPNVRRPFQRDLTEFVRQHRIELLEELAGMVEFWNQHGRAEGSARHRLAYWARTIGGILDANSLPRFLENQAEAAAEFNTDMEQLGSLAEAALRTGPHQQGSASLFRAVESLEPDSVTTHAPDVGRPPRELEPLFRDANVLTEKLNGIPSQAGKATSIGIFLSRLVNRRAKVMEQGPGGRQGTAVLRTVIRPHGNQKVYFFEIKWDDSPAAPPSGPTAGVSGPVGQAPESVPVSPLPDSTIPEQPLIPEQPPPAPAHRQGGNQLNW